MTVARTNSTTITVSLPKSNSSNYLQFPNGNTNVRLQVGLATSSNGTYTYKTVYEGDPYSSQVSFTSNASWTFTVTAATTSQSLYIKYRVYDTGNESSTVITPGSGSSWTATFNASYTACGAPTTASVSRTIASLTNPAGSVTNTVTLTWSGATAGTNNDITGYRIYVAYSKYVETIADSVTHYDVSSTSTSGSYTVTIPNIPDAASKRGYSIGFSIRTLGAQLDSDIKKFSAVKINRLPSAPSVGSNTYNIPSTASTASVTFTAGTDGDGQTYNVRRGTSATGVPVATNLTSPVDCAPGTWYFWTWDGLEYSAEPEMVTVTQDVDTDDIRDEYPVGGVCIMSTNTNPATAGIGGSWTLIDKKFSNQEVSSTSAFIVNTTNASTVNSCIMVKGGHSLTLRLSVNNKVALSTSELNLGHFDLSLLGLERVTFNQYYIGYSDGANAFFRVRMDNTPNLYINTPIVKNKSTTTIAANSTLWIMVHYTFTVLDYMADDACDKFYFKRTA